MLVQIREFCLALPQTAERLSHGVPSFFIGGKKCFAMYQENHHQIGYPAIWCACDVGFRDLLLGEVGYFYPPYVGHRGWLGINLLEVADNETIFAHLQAAHQHVFSPKHSPQLVPR